MVWGYILLQICAGDPQVASFCRHHAVHAAVASFLNDTCNGCCTTDAGGSRHNGAEPVALFVLWLKPCSWQRQLCMARCPQLDRLLAVAAAAAAQQAEEVLPPTAAPAAVQMAAVAAVPAMAATVAVA